ncbi:GTPase ObgE [Kordiimonas sp. SCSIO 12603]|uniref:GTPase ObgE n=1 Tax=Kordiimonas sp. SCSIO 12603 TaxID=2829596 RepID=UPI002106BAE9|nr:GTPase ObgE [Kordiimonas sp. SCSIO 12603]UTW59739.1 GTPase ObgE [Kordiimonas sp. SCSIO 12603]
MKFVDQTRIFVKSGPGGNGIVSFRREKYVEFGGPNGGDGGKGGDITFEAVEGLNTLVDYRYKRHYKAPKGQHGMGKNMTGAAGKDMILKVPVGTQIYDEDQEFILADLAKEGDTITLLKGGEGGLGNTHFKTSTNRAPRRCTAGGEGEEMWIVLRLKLIADAGLLGLPNAGKSTFLSAVSRARPKIADYPFTTIRPQLGVVGFKNNEFVMADIPGLIEGASEGVGLGHRFLGHVERCGVLLHLIDGTQEDVVDSYETIMNEVNEYGGELIGKPMIIGLNKIDSLTDEEIAEKKAALEEASGDVVYPLSGATGGNVPEVLGALWEIVKVDMANRRKDEEEIEEEQEEETESTGGWSPI